MLPDWVEQDSPIGHAHASRHKSEEDEPQPRRRPVKDVDQKKTKDEEQARSHRLKKGKFESALTKIGSKVAASPRVLRKRCFALPFRTQKFFASYTRDAQSGTHRLLAGATHTTHHAGPQWRFMQSFIRTLTGYALNAHKAGGTSLRRT